MDKDERAFYERGWFTVLMLFVFFPVGLYLMWKYKKFNKVARVVVTTGFGIYLVVWMFLWVLIIASIGSSTETTANESAPAVESQKEVDSNSESKEVANPVTEDVLRYVNESLMPLAKQESEIINLYGSVTGENYVDDETTYRALVDKIIPKYNIFISDLENVEIQTAELREVHEIYIKGANMQNNAFISFMSAIEEQDLDKMNETNTTLAEARALIRDYQNQVRTLAEENNVKIGE